MIDFNDVGTAMLQDAVWANADWLAEEGNAEIAEKFLRASFRGWIFCRDNFDECVQIVLDNGPALGASHQAWQLNEINKLIWPSRAGSALWISSRGRRRSPWLPVRVSSPQCPRMGATGPTSPRRRSTLDADGLDTTGTGYTPREVTLSPGGE